MSVFPTNKTVPLTKDIASTSPKTASLGISSARTDLESILTAIDNAIAANASTSSSAISAEATARSNADTNLQTQITNEAATRLANDNTEASTRLANDNAEITARGAADTILQSEIDGERSPLRMTAATTTVAVASASATRIDNTGVANSKLGLVSGVFLSDFPGATIDFSAGTIAYTGGSPSAGSFTTATPTGNASQYTKYSVVLLATAPDTLLVTWGGVYASTAAGVASPVASGGVPVGIVTVQINSGGTGIQNILQTNLVQFQASGSGSGSGGSGSPLDPVQESTFVYYTRSDFSTDAKALFLSTTGSDQILGLKKLTLGVGQQMLSKNLCGAIIASDAVAINTAQAKLLYTVGKVDLIPTIELSRDGGASYTTATRTALSASGNTIIGDVTFPVSTAALYDGGTGNGTDSGTQNRYAALITPTFQTIINSFSLSILSSVTGGTLTGALYSVTSGTPQTLLASCAEIYVPGQDIVGTYTDAKFTLTAPITLTAGTTYALVVTGTSATLKGQRVTSAPAFSSGSATFSAGWSASASNLAYKLYGTGLDLRLRLTSGTAGSELLGFGVEFVQGSEAGSTGYTAYEERTLTSTEASTGQITLTAISSTPGAKQLLVFASGHTFSEGDFQLLATNVVKFPAGFFQPGDFVRFYNSYGLVDGTSSALGKIALLQDAIVGSSAQVASGLATHSSITSAISAVASGGKVRVLNGTYTENLTISSKVTIEGSGNGCTLNGTCTFASGSTGSSVNFLRFANNIAFNSGVDNVILMACWLATTRTITNSGGAGNIWLISQE